MAFKGAMVKTTLGRGPSFSPNRQKPSLMDSIKLAVTPSKKPDNGMLNIP